MAKRSSISFSLCFILVLGILLIGSHECSQPTHVPGIFIFGDSTVDVGTNHFLPPSECKARADFLPNGIDFPHSIPTGRFSNGFNIVDYLAKLILGSSMSPPPFLSLVRKNQQIPNTTVSLLVKGVNFASGGSGLLDETGKGKWGKVIPFGEQVGQFGIVRNIISELLGEGAVANISKSLFLVSVGSNDIFEYFAYKKSASAQEFITTIMSTYESRLRNLFDAGARRFGIISVASIGCVPVQRSRTQNGGCFEPMNVVAQMFYEAVQDILLKLTSQCEGMVYSLADAYNMTTLIIQKPQQFGFKEVTKACCGRGGKFNADFECTPTPELCRGRNDYLFWDQYHPTQNASYLAALAVYGGPQFVEPMSFGQLAGLA